MYASKWNPAGGKLASAAEKCKALQHYGKKMDVCIDALKIWAFVHGALLVQEVRSFSLDCSGLSIS